MREIKIGDRVDYHSIIGGPVTSSGHIVRDVGVLGSKKVVAWISDKAGCVSLDALTPAGADHE